MSPRTTSSSSQASVSYTVDPSVYPDFEDYSTMVYGTPGSKKGGYGVTHYSQTRQTSELNRMSWEKEIEGKVSVFDEPVESFLDVFVPGRGASRRRYEAKIKNTFKVVPSEGIESDKYTDLVRHGSCMAF